MINGCTQLGWRVSHQYLSNPNYTETGTQPDG